MFTKTTGLLSLIGAFLLLPSLVLAADIPTSNDTVQRGVQVPDVGAVGRVKNSALNIGWIKYQYAPSDTAIKQKAQAAKSQGFNILISIAKNPNGSRLSSNDDPSSCSGGYGDYKNFLARTAADIGGNADAYEIGNEPNKSGEWDSSNWGPFSLEKYAGLLSCGAQGIKSGNSGASTISAGFSPNDTPNQIDSLNRLADLNAFANVDYIGAHIYSDQSTPPDSDQSSFSGLSSINDVASRVGKKIWVTEFGWKRSSVGGDRTKQIALINQAYSVAAQKYSQIAGMIIWNFGFGTSTNTGAEGAEFEDYNVDTSPSQPLKNPAGININVGAQASYKTAQGASDKPSFTVSNINGKNVIAYTPKSAGTNCPSGTGTAQSGPNDQLISRSLNNDAAQLAQESQALLPSELNSSATGSTNVKTGVEDNFFIGGLKSLICKITGNLCAADVKLPGDTTDFAQKAVNLGMSQLPNNITLEPAQNDCNVVDVVDQKTGETQVGNQRFEEVSAFDTNALTLPKMSDADKNLADCAKTDNFVIGNGQSSTDLRTCQKNIDAQNQKRALFPLGIEPLPETDSKYLK